MLVKVLDGKNRTYTYLHELKEKGFGFSSEPEPHWYKQVSEGDLVKLEAWCFKRKLKIKTPVSERSYDYRARFFESNPGVFSTRRYVCVYCGWVLKQDKVSVDHLISVKKAQTSRFYLRLIRKRGWSSVNDVRNLVPACKRCNSRKGAKGRLWVLRGFLGRKWWFWVIYRTTQLLIIAALFRLTIST